MTAQATHRFDNSRLWLEWSGRVAAGFALAPERFAQRLEQVFRAPPTGAVSETGRLIEDVFQLIGAHAPEIDLEWAIGRCSSPRTA